MERIIVVGGAGGIGSAIVEKYLELLGNEDIEIIIGDIDDESAKKVVNLDEDKITYYRVNTKELSDIRDFREKVEDEHGTISHLISLAGFALDGEFSGLKSTKYDVIEESLDLNLKSHVYITKEFKELLEEDNRDDKNIILISSINALQDYGLPAYSSAKAGLIGLTNSTVEEFGKEGIRINTVLPGTVTSQRSSDEPKDNEKLRKTSPLNRLSTPEEVGKVVYSLTHMMSSVTGEQIVADCGQTKKGVNYIED